MESVTKTDNNVKQNEVLPGENKENNSSDLSDNEINALVDEVVPNSTK